MNEKIPGKGICLNFLIVPLKKFSGNFYFNIYEKISFHNPFNLDFQLFR